MVVTHIRTVSTQLVIYTDNETSRTKKLCQISKISVEVYRHSAWIIQVLVSLYTVQSIVSSRYHNCVNS